MKITVFGLGYVGASTAFCLARRYPVTAVDVIEEKVAAVREKRAPVADADMEELLRRGELDLTVTTEVKSAVRGADFVVIAVPTDFSEEIGGLQTAAIDGIVSAVDKINPETVFVVRSTVGVGYMDALRAAYPGHVFLYCPEFLREGSAMHDCLHPQRIVVGTSVNDEAAVSAAKHFAQMLLEGMRADAQGDIWTSPPVMVMALKEAESVKLFSNTYLAMRVAFFNELDIFARAHKMETASIIAAVCADKRIGDYYNNPSFGFGGTCLPKDARQLNHDVREMRLELLPAIIRANEERSVYVAEQIMHAVGFLPARNTRPVIGVYRIVAKQGSDNFHCSASVAVIARLLEAGLQVLVYEPLLSDIDELERLLPEPLRQSGRLSLEADLQCFQDTCAVIAANRTEDALLQVKEKLFTCDIYHSG